MYNKRPWPSLQNVQFLTELSRDLPKFFLTKYVSYVKDFITFFLRYFTISLQITFLLQMFVGQVWFFLSFFFKDQLISICKLGEFVVYITAYSQVNETAKSMTKNAHHAWIKQKLSKLCAATCSTQQTQYCSLPLIHIKTQEPNSTLTGWSLGHSPPHSKVSSKCDHNSLRYTAKCHFITPYLVMTKNPGTKKKL